MPGKCFVVVMTHGLRARSVTASRPSKQPEEVRAMSTTTATDELRGRFGAEVILPDDAGYDEARALHNAMIDKGPAVIVRCGSADDIVDALGFARTSNLAVAVRGGGHNGPGFGSVEG